MKSIFRKLELVLFYIFNFYKYKKLEFKSIIRKPLRIEGSKYITIKKHSNIKKYSWLLAIKKDEIKPELIIGEGCDIGDFNHIVALRRVVIEDNVITANRVYISDNYHGYEDIETPIMFQEVKHKSDVRIGKGSWIGENAAIIGVNIGRNCVIGANAVVTKDIPDYCIAAGVPAKIIKKYNNNSKKWERTDENGEFK